MSNIHCPVIHGALQINLKKDPQKVYINQCCLRGDLRESTTENVWASQTLHRLRELNKTNTWDRSCSPCKSMEDAGLTSFRTGMIEKFGIRTNLSGPQRLDLMFDVSCNLACRTCGPHVSTFWQKHLTENKVQFIAPRPESRADDMIAILETLDLSNLETVVFCGGETLLGQSHWRVAEALARLVPDAKEKLSLNFQTNGTQPIIERNYETIEKFQTVRLNISLDGVGNRFNYLRWPADWEQVTENIFKIREECPVNMSLLVEETISIFNLFYTDELSNWLANNFSTDRMGDAILHTQHMANGMYAVDRLTQQYYNALGEQKQKLLNPSWVETEYRVAQMVAEIKKFDNLRGQDWTKVFPELAGFYSKYL